MRSLILLPLLLLFAALDASAQALHLGATDLVELELSEPLPSRMTIEAWLRTSRPQTSLPLYVGRTGDSADGFGFIVHDGYRSDAGLEVSAIVGGRAWSVTGSSVPLAPATWTHVALVRDDSVWTLYRNGMIAGRGVATTSGVTPRLSIGRFEGELDEVRLWSRARSAEEIARHAMTSVEPDATDLVAWYRFDSIDAGVARNAAATGSVCDLQLRASTTIRLVADAPTLAAEPAPRAELVAMPRHRQFLAREADDSATVRVAGRLVDRCDSVALTLHCDGAPVLRTTMPAPAGSSFELATRIASRMAQYTVRLLGLVDGEWRMIAEGADLVAGDVYVIAGQSNSHPSSPYVTWTSPYVRTIGVQTRNGNYDAYDPADTHFTLGNAHGHDWGYAGPGLIGVWGIRLAELLLRSDRRPLCFVNGGAGGSSIEQNARDADAPTNLATIYGRTLYRLEKGGLREHVRAILWHQGESNGLWNYASNITRLVANWRGDYPSLERIFLYQIRPGCGGSRHVELRDLQRTLDDSLEGVTTLATVGLRGHDGCHYTDAGYGAMGEQTYAVMREWLDGVPESQRRAVHPEIRSAWFTTAARDEVVLLFRAGAPLVCQGDTTVGGARRTLASAFSFDEATDLVASVRASGDTVVLRLRRPLTERTIAYVPDKYYPGTSDLYEGPWIVDTAGFGAFAFSGVAIASERAAADAHDGARMLEVAPSPSTGRVTIRIALETPSRVRLVSYDAAGRERLLLEDVLPAGRRILHLDEFPPGIHHCRLVAGDRTETAPIVVVR